MNRTPYTQMLQNFRNWVMDNQRLAAGIAVLFIVCVVVVASQYGCPR